MSKSQSKSSRRPVCSGVDQTDENSFDLRNEKTYTCTDSQNERLGHDTDEPLSETDD